MKLRRLKKILIATIIVLLLIAAWLSYYQSRPLQPPRLSLQFQEFEPNKTKIMPLTCETNQSGEVQFFASNDAMWVRVGTNSFPTSQTNSLAIMCLTNNGPTRIWWTAWMDCRVEARTPNGWVTNQAMYLSWTPYSVGGSATDTFGVRVPSDAIEWRVHGWYQFYKSHNARMEFFGWLMDDLGFGLKFPGDKPKSKFLTYGVVLPLAVVGSTLRFLPEPQKEIGEVTSELFTNRPPVFFPPVNQPKP